MMVSRDPFAREEIHRSKIDVIKATCDWCGSVWPPAKSSKTQFPYLYEYCVVPDSLYGRINPIKGLFCCTDCMKAYHNVD